jgi:hypothetical protein
VIGDTHRPVTTGSVGIARSNGAIQPGMHVGHVARRCCSRSRLCAADLSTVATTSLAGLATPPFHLTGP